jgi:osmotically-inducible protein OsmY
MTLGIIAMSPGMTMGGPLSFMKNSAAETAGSGAQPAQPGRRSNQQVAENVAHALRDAGLTGYDIDIEFKSGIAVLSGKVDSLEQKNAATAAIERIPEVKRVDNRLTPVQSLRPDNQQVSFDPEASRTKPQIQPGNVADEFQRAEGQQVAAIAPQPGAPVTNAIAESAGARSAATNQQVAEQIAAALSSASLNGYNIEIRYQDGAATLAGAVSTPQQREIAGQVVSKVPGVETVNNRLTCPGVDQAAAQQALASRQLAMAAYQPPGAGPQGPLPPGAAPLPPGAGPAPYAGPMGGQPVLNNPNLPSYAWPAYASYPNYAQVTYPQQYSASAWPYIGPFYPYPQVPLGWRQVQLEWDDGMWNLNFRPRTDRWWWFLHPKNW